MLGCLLHGHCFLVFPIQPSVADLVVDHDGVHVAVAECVLKRIERHPALCHVGGKRMAKCVRMDARRAGGCARLLADGDPGAVAKRLAEASSTEVDEHHVMLECSRPFETEVIAECGNGLLCHRHQTLSFALTWPDG